MIVLEKHPTQDITFVKCDDCGASCIQGSSGQANILRHKKNCDHPERPTTEQLSGKPAPVATASPVAAPSVLSARDQAIYEDLTRKRGKMVSAEEAAELRRTGHSWRDIASGNHDT